VQRRNATHMASSPGSSATDTAKSLYMGMPFSDVIPMTAESGTFNTPEMAARGRCHHARHRGWRALQLSTSARGVGRGSTSGAVGLAWPPPLPVLSPLRIRGAPSSAPRRPLDPAQSTATVAFASCAEPSSYARAPPGQPPCSFSWWLMAGAGLF
jgi:hypothetical protein